MELRDPENRARGFERGDHVDRDLVEEFASQRANEPFGESIHIGCLDGDAHNSCVDCGEGAGKPDAESL